MSPLDSSGRRHTSFASVYVNPVMEDDIDVDIKREEIRVDTYRASGAGGMRIADVGMGLPPDMAVCSARLDKRLPSGRPVAGKASLAGEARPTPQMTPRTRTGKEIGMGGVSGWRRRRTGKQTPEENGPGVLSIGDAMRVLIAWCTDSECHRASPGLLFLKHVGRSALGIIVVPVPGGNDRVVSRHCNAATEN